MKNLYISPIGNDNNNGTIEAPFKTLYKATEVALNENEDVTIYLREGRYFFPKSLRIENTYNKNIIFKAYENETVYFDGGIVVDNKFVKKTDDKEILDRIIEEKAREHIYEIDFSSYNIDVASYGTRGFRRAYVPSPNELYINSEPQNVAQYPNENCGEIPLTKVVDAGSNPFKGDFTMRPCSFVCDDERYKKWGKISDMYVAGIFTWAFADDTMKITYLDVNTGIMTTELPHLPSMIAKPHSRYKVLNLLEEIDVPKEYFVDKETKKVYFYPENENLENAQIQISVLDTPMIVMKNCEKVEFIGITMENTRGTAVYMENTDFCKIDSCTIRNVGMLAVQIGQGATAMKEGMHDAHGVQSPQIGAPKGESEIMGSWHEMLYQFAAWNNNGGTNNTVENCEIYNCATGGIMVGGGDRKKLISANNRIHNCHIYRTNRLDRTYKGGINIMGVGNSITNCDIHDMPGFAIYLHGNDHKIHYNEIYDVINDVSDAGAIYMGRDVTEAGNEFNYNFIHDIYGSKNKSIGICAIYFDDGACFNCVKGNYFYRVIQRDAQSPTGVMGTIFWGWGSQTSVSDNIFVECPIPLKTSYHTANLVRKHYFGDRGELFIPRTFTKEDNDFRGVDIESEIWREKYPYIYDVFKENGGLGTVLYNNLFPLDTRWFKDAENLDFTILDKKPFEDNILWYVTDPILNIVDENISFTVTDFDKIGRIKE